MDGRMEGRKEFELHNENSENSGNVQYMYWPPFMSQTDFAAHTSCNTDTIFDY